MTHDPKFQTKAGWLTRYAMACGYLHRQWNVGTAKLSVNFELVTDFYRVETVGGNPRWHTHYEGHDVNAARKAYTKALKLAGGNHVWFIDRMNHAVMRT